MIGPGSDKKVKISQFGHNCKPFCVKNSKWTNFHLCPLRLSNCLLWMENQERIQVWPDFEKQLPDGRLWRHMAPNVSVTTQIRIWYSFRTKRGESRSDIYLKHRTSEKLLRRRESLSKRSATPAPSTPKSGAAPRITSCPPTQNGMLIVHFWFPCVTLWRSSHFLDFGRPSSRRQCRL